MTEIIKYQSVELDSENNQHTQKVLCPSMKYICDSYGVPAKIGDNVLFRGEKALITGAVNSYLRLKNDKGESFLAHPTWEIFYIDDFNNKLESQNKTDKAFLDQHMPQTLEVLAKADALINKIDRNK